MIEHIINKFVPPALNRGKVSPFVGKSPVATPTLMNTCNPIKIAAPKQKKKPK